MDDELRRELRAFAAAPDDPGAIRLAAAFERLRRFPAAWQLLARRLGVGDDHAVLGALGGLAARNRTATVAYIRAEGVNEARFSCLALSRAGELFPLVVLACEAAEDDLRATAAAIGLRRALQDRFPRLPGVLPLAGFLRGSDVLMWTATSRTQLRIVEQYGLDEAIHELGFTGDEEELAPVRALFPFSLQPPVAGFLIPPTLVPRSDRRDWDAYARTLLDQARKERSLVLLPWVSGMRSAMDGRLASDAVALFQELTGKLVPPLDPDDFARRWA